MISSKQIYRILPYSFRFVNAATLDVVDAVSNDAARDRGSRKILATAKVYDNESRVAFEVSEIDTTHTGILITMLSPSLKLSEKGQERTLTHLIDSIEQLMENTLLGPVSISS